MKKSAVVIATSMILLIGISNACAADIWGYPVVEKQVKFYSIILSVIATSTALVAGSYLLFWLTDLRKRVVKPVLRKEAKSFADGLMAAAQSAK